MIVVIEGPDGTGKTTLAKQLAKQGMIYEYRARHYNFTDEEMKRMLEDDRTHVLDRSFLTTWVYRVVQQEPLDECDFTFEQTMQYMKSGRLKIVHCTYPYGFQKAMERGEDNITNQEVWNTLRKGYVFAINTIRIFNLCKVYDYCWSMQEVDDVMKFIKEE